MSTATERQAVQTPCDVGRVWDMDEGGRDEGALIAVSNDEHIWNVRRL